jgi:hypothetical protein
MSQKESKREYARIAIKKAVKKYQKCENFRNVMAPLSKLSLHDPEPEPLGWTLLHLHNTNATNGHKGRDFTVDEIKRPPMPKPKKEKNINHDNPDNTEDENFDWAEKKMRNRRFASLYLHFPICFKDREEIKKHLKRELGLDRHYAVDLSHRHIQLMNCAHELHYVRMCGIDLPHELLPNSTTKVPVRTDVAIGLEINGQFIFSEKLVLQARRVAEYAFGEDMEPCECPSPSPKVTVTMILDGQTRTVDQCVHRTFTLCRQVRDVIEVSKPETMVESRRMKAKAIYRRHGDQAFTSERNLHAAAVMKAM